MHYERRDCAGAEACDGVVLLSAGEGGEEERRGGEERRRGKEDGRIGGWEDERWEISGLGLGLGVSRPRDPRRPKETHIARCSSLFLSLLWTHDGRIAKERRRIRRHTGRSSRTQGAAGTS